MTPTALVKDPTNVIITGVGGQGNVTASRMLGKVLARRGLAVTIGETFGASQRGGSVMSHLRVSRRQGLSPQIPRGACDLVVALEPTEALRVLAAYGRPETVALVNTRPVHAIGVISGERDYPPPDELARHIAALCRAALFLDATGVASALGSPILGNVVMIGAACAAGPLPVERAEFAAIVEESLPPDRRALNLAAFDRGREAALTSPSWTASLGASP